MERRLVAVIGGSDAEPVVIAQARELGVALARQGLSVLCGGRGGIMAAACQGLREARDAAPGDSAVASALAVGILPGPDGHDANTWLDVVIPTGLGLARNAIIARAARAVIAVGGGSGTLSEAALAWQFGLPVCALAASGGWAAKLAGTRLDGRRTDVVHSAPDALDAARWAARVIGREPTA